MIHLAFLLIKLFEGLRLSAYKDSGGVWTIGYGHTGPEVKEGLTITTSQAEELFQKDAAPLFALVSDKNPIEGAALVSFGYNCGLGALKNLLSGKISMSTYGRKDIKGNILPGLVARRELESALIEASKSPAQSIS